NVTYYCGRGKTGLDVLHELVASHREAGDKQKGAEHLAWLASLLEEDGHAGEALNLATEALETAAGISDQITQSRVYTVYAHALMTARRFEDTIRWATTARDISAGQSDREGAIDASIALGSALLEVDEP